MIPTTRTFALFLRHADRHPIPAAEPYADVDLTPRGYAAVAELGRRLEGRVRWTASSPFRRCRETARGLGCEPAVDTRLGQHGPWVADHEEAAREFERRGTEGVVRAQIAGVELAGFRRPEEAVPLLLSAGLDRLSQGSGVCVTHDAVLMPAMAWLFGADAAESWLAPLDGFTVHLGPRGPAASWKGRQRSC